MTLAALLLALVQPSEPIIVEGQRRPTHKQALRAVTDMTVITESQIARFHDPVCPLVIGMQRSAATLIEQRMRQVVREVGGRAANQRCEANLMVFIAEDAAGLIRDIELKRPRWLEGVSAAEKRHLLAEGSTKAWSVSSVRNEDGHRPSIGEVAVRRKPVPTSPAAGVRGSSATDSIPQMRVHTNSFLRSANRYHLDGSVVVIEADAAEGLTLRQIADYAVMRGLAKIRPPENVAQLDSILSVVADRSGAPKQLTSFDLRYLRQLYAHLDQKGFESSVFERQRLAKAVSTGS